MNIPARHAFIIAASVAALSVQAAGGDEPQPRDAAPADPIVEKVIAANQRKDWDGAQATLRDALLKDPRNADYHNLYAYAIRMGNQPNLDLVFKHYNEALRINPKHRGAHEYIGEAYLMTGNVAKAKDHLAQLERLCAAGCEERAALQREISLFERQHAAK